MIFKLRIGDIRITFTLAIIEDVVGVNSNIDKDKHILMWDFDNSTQTDVEAALTMIQLLYNLSTIYILNTGKPKSHIAFCFTTVPILKAVEILSQTPGICWGFLKWGIIRNKFTLRVTAKSGRNHKLVTKLVSQRPGDVTIKDLKHWVQYETLPDYFPVKIIAKEYLHAGRGHPR